MRAASAFYQWQGCDYFIIMTKAAETRDWHHERKMKLICDTKEAEYLRYTEMSASVSHYKYVISCFLQASPRHTPSSLSDPLQLHWGLKGSPPLPEYFKGEVPGPDKVAIQAKVSSFAFYRWGEGGLKIGVGKDVNREPSLHLCVNRQKMV